MPRPLVGALCSGFWVLVGGCLRFCDDRFDIVCDALDAGWQPAFGAVAGVLGCWCRPLTLGAGRIIKPSIVAFQRQRNTPAGTGRTARWGRSAKIAGEHPRRYGANPRYLSIVGRVRGTPPCVRGQRSQGTEECDWSRNTPACAGRADGYGRHDRAVGVYPRMCGAIRFARPTPFRLLGIPPYVRGERPGETEHILSERNTPVCAGRALAVE